MTVAAGRSGAKREFVVGKTQEDDATECGEREDKMHAPTHTEINKKRENRKFQERQWLENSPYARRQHIFLFFKKTNLLQLCLSVNNL